MAGASAAAVWPNGEPLICSYARAGNATLVLMLAQYGADIDAATRATGVTPLMAAIDERHLEAARCLLERGASVAARDADGRSALVHAAAAADDDAALFALVYEADWPSTAAAAETMATTTATTTTTTSQDDRAADVQRAFETATEVGNVAVCRYMLDNAPVDLRTSVLIACHSGKTDLVQLMLSRGATLSRDARWKGRSALLCAVQSGSWDLVVSVLGGGGDDDDEKLASGGARVNAETTADGDSALMIAAVSWHAGDKMQNGARRFSAVATSV